jgi:hypothetical protein
MLRWPSHAWRGGIAFVLSPAKGASRTETQQLSSPLPIVGSTSIPVAKLGIPTIGIEASPSVLQDLTTNVSLNSPLRYTIISNAVVKAEMGTSGGVAKAITDLKHTRIVTLAVEQMKSPAWGNRGLSAFHGV